MGYSIKKCSEYSGGTGCYEIIHSVKSFTIYCFLTELFINTSPYLNNISLDDFLIKQLESLSIADKSYSYLVFGGSHDSLKNVRQNTIEKHFSMPGDLYFFDQGSLSKVEPLFN